MSVELLPIEGIPEIRAGDDLGAILANAVGRHDLTSTDVLVVTSKIVSKAEGRVVRADREEVIRSQTRSVVARRGDLVIARTSHAMCSASSVRRDQSRNTPSCSLSSAALVSATRSCADPFITPKCAHEIAPVPVHTAKHHQHRDCRC